MNVMLTVGGGGKEEAESGSNFGLYRVAGTYQDTYGYVWVLRTSM